MFGWPFYDEQTVVKLARSPIDQKECQEWSHWTDRVDDSIQQGSQYGASAGQTSAID